MRKVLLWLRKTLGDKTARAEYAVIVAIILTILYLAIFYGPNSITSSATMVTCEPQGCDR